MPKRLIQATGASRVAGRERRDRTQGKNAVTSRRPREAPVCEVDGVHLPPRTGSFVSAFTRHLDQHRAAVTRRLHSSSTKQTGKTMIQRIGTLTLAAAAAACFAGAAHAQTRVQYGRITNVQATTVTDTTARNVGTLVGGGIGLATGSGQSGSNRALRTVGGAAAGRGVGTLAGRSQAFEYTVLVDGTSTVRIVSDQAGKRVGDCVAVEQGQFANIRLVPDSRCAPRAQAAPAKAAPPPAPVAADVQQATACEQAKEQVLAANTDEEFNLAERRMRLLCGE
jgi:outer membrane lipoprotein SlyB